jgi:hypothetical protein
VILSVTYSCTYLVHPSRIFVHIHTYLVQPKTRADLGIGAVCMRTALFTDVGIYEACNNKVRYYRKSVMRRVYLGE